VHDFKLEARNVNGDLVVAPTAGKLEVKSAGNATAVSHFVLTIVNLQLTNPGVINFTLFIDDKELASIPLYLNTVA
jgi:hypothetical protein